jgi:Ras-related protein Rab-8A
MKIELITLGDSQVGKSSLLQRFSDDRFSGNYITTMGIDFKIKYLQIDGKNIKLLMWDTAGQERFRTMTMQYFNKADCVIFAYDCTSEESFNSMRHWIRQFESHTNGRTDIEKVLVGNKSDMTDEKMIEAEQGAALAAEFGMNFYETSAKSGLNVQLVFSSLAQKVKEKKE